MNETKTVISAIDRGRLSDISLAVAEAKAICGLLENAAAGDMELDDGDVYNAMCVANQRLKDALGVLHSVGAEAVEARCAAE